MSSQKERPILMSSEMVRAIIDGRKTMTRRIVNKVGGYREFFFENDRRVVDAQSMLTHMGPERVADWMCPYGQPGDRLWVRETFQVADNVVTKPVVFYAADERLATSEWPDGLWNVDKWRPSIFMPRWASRLTLEITAVRVERLQTISDADAIAEGVAKLYRTPRWLDGEARRQFETLWDGINGKRAPWVRNPFVWIIEFKRLEESDHG